MDDNRVPIAERNGQNHDYAGLQLSKVAVASYEATMQARAGTVAEGAIAGVSSTVSSDGVDAVLDHYRERLAA